MLLAVKSAGMAGIYSPRSNLAVPTRTATNIWSDSTSFPPLPRHPIPAIMPSVWISSKIPTATQSGAASSTRNNLGPLTTVFTPSPTCEECFVAATALNGGCRAHYTDCHNPRRCMPGDNAWELFAVYSPGLVCPAGWTIATMVSAEMTDRLTARDVISRLEHGETAGFCCPT